LNGILKRVFSGHGVRKFLKNTPILFFNNLWAKEHLFPEAKEHFFPEKDVEMPVMMFKI
jgi:hypothetical protein